MPEPVFGIVKSPIGFRQFMLRGIHQVRGQRSLVTMGMERGADIRASSRLMRRP
jgi:hypothetical protein